MNTYRNTSSILRPFSVAAALAGCCLFFTSGACNRGPVKPDHIPDLTPLTVTVTYEGQPLPEANVTLAPKSGTFSAAGITDSAGQAIMKTDALYEGVVPGEYLATVTKREKLDLNLPPAPDDPDEYDKWEEMLKAQPIPKHLIPEKYASFGSSGLNVTVAAGTPGQVTLELND